MIRKVVVMVLMSAGLSSCTRSLSPEELVRWTDDPEHGITVEQSQGKFMYKAKFLPAELSAWKEMQINEEPFSDSLFETRTRGYKSSAVFEVRLVAVKNDSAYAKALMETQGMYLDFGMSGDWALVTSSDTVYCQVAHVERSAQLLNELKITLGFDKNLYTGTHPDATFSLYYRGPVSDGKLMTFNYQGSDLEKIPHLTY